MIYSHISIVKIAIAETNGKQRSVRMRKPSGRPSHPQTLSNQSPDHYLAPGNRRGAIMLHVQLPFSELYQWCICFSPLQTSRSFGLLGPIREDIGLEHDNQTSIDEGGATSLICGEATATGSTLLAVPFDAKPTKSFSPPDLKVRIPDRLYDPRDQSL